MSTLKSGDFPLNVHTVYESKPLLHAFFCSLYEHSSDVISYPGKLTEAESLSVLQVTNIIIKTGGDTGFDCKIKGALAPAALFMC